MARFSVRLEEAGFVLVLLHFVLLQLSHRFTYGLSIDEKPVFWLVGLLTGSGFVYVLACLKVMRCSSYSFSINRTLLLILTVGLILRVSMLFSTPMLEDDYYRYLWDGAVVSQGKNPYAYSPKDIINQQNIPANLSSLALESGHVIERVNHPELRTIYPPVAQAAFSIACWIKPWSLNAWRFVLLLGDLCSLGLLMVILKKLNLSPALILIFWWNPLYVKEVFNSGHMEGVLVPFLFGLILFIIYNRHLMALICLVLAVGVKLWPVVLLPVLLRPCLSDVKRLFIFLSIFCLLFLGMFWPVHRAGFDTTSGFIAYGQLWQMNDSLFTLIFWASRFILHLFALDIHTSHLVAKGAVLFILALLTVFLNQRTFTGGKEFCKRCLGITAGLFLLSPTQFPWYSIWFLPFLAVAPRNVSLLLLSPLLSIYYVRFYFNGHNQIDLFDNYLVWLEFIPVWLLLTWELYKGRARGRKELEEVSSTA